MIPHSRRIKIIMVKEKQEPIIKLTYTNSREPYCNIGFIVIKKTANNIPFINMVKTYTNIKLQITRK